MTKNKHQVLKKTTAGKLVSKCAAEQLSVYCMYNLCACESKCMHVYANIHACVYK